MKEYILRHREEPVLEFGIGDTFNFVNYVKVLDDKFSPVSEKYSDIDKAVILNNWLNNRCVPDSRDGVERLRKEYKINDLKDLLLASYGLSLSDHYWIDRKPFQFKWKDINLFENRYSDIIGNILFDKKFKLVGNADRNEFNPDLTTGGNLKKRWQYDERSKISYLIKSGSSLYRQEPFNEHYVSLLLKSLSFNYVSYDIRKEGNEYVSVCPCIADISKEMVSAKDLKFKYGLEESYESIVLLGKRRGCASYENSLKKMIIADYICDNTDRHWNNFGIIRDTETGAWLGASPLYDNGYSLWNNDFIDIEKPSKSRSFKDYNIENMKYVNICNFVKKMPDLVNIFDIAFEKYENKERKIQLREGISLKQKEIEEVIEKSYKTQSQLNIDKNIVVTVQ